MLNKEAKFKKGDVIFYLLSYTEIIKNKITNIEEKYIDNELSSRKYIIMKGDLFENEIFSSEDEARAAIMKMVKVVDLTKFQP